MLQAKREPEGKEVTAVSFPLVYRARHRFPRRKIILVLSIFQTGDDVKNCFSPILLGFTQLKEVLVEFCECERRS